MKENMMTKALVFSDAHVASSLTWPLNVGRQVAQGLHSMTLLLRTKITDFAIDVLKTKLEKYAVALQKRQTHHQVHPVWKLTAPYLLLSIPSPCKKL